MDCKKIGEYIQTKRKAVGLTQEQLGDMLGITSKAVSKWECGVAIPDVSLFPELVKILQIDISELLNGEDNIKTPVDKKKNYLIIILLIVISLLIVFIISLGIYFKSNYSKVKVYDLVSSTDSFYVDGKLINIGDKSYLTISKVDYFGKDADSLVYIYDLEFKLYYGNSLLYRNGKIEKTKEQYLTKESSLKNLFASIFLFYNDEDNNVSSENIEEDDIYFILKINVIDSSLSLQEFDIILNTIN